MILTFLLIILLFIILYSFKKEYFKNYKILGSNLNDNNINIDDAKIKIGTNSDNSFLTNKSQFYLNCIDDNNNYLNVSDKCAKQNNYKNCMGYSEKIQQLILTKKKDYDKFLNSGLWIFDDIKNTGDKYIYYGQEIFIRSLSSLNGYICICEIDSGMEVGFGKRVPIYSYANIRDAELNGRWILIPNYNKKTFKNLECNKMNYDFWNNIEEKENPISDLLLQKLPVNLRDNFYIVNQKKINNKYVFLNLFPNPITCMKSRSNEKTKEKECIGFLNNNTKLDLKDIEQYRYIWNIKPIKFKIDVKDTLFIDGSFQLGDVLVDGDTLRYIKRIPYHFTDKLCLGSSSQENIDMDISCINKHHIEMINGNRPINLNTFVPLKPFILYSKPNYSGRELRIGFDYPDTRELPILKSRNGWFDPENHSKWFSLKIKGNYIVAIYYKNNYGQGDFDPDDEVEGFQSNLIEGFKCYGTGKKLRKCRERRRKKNEEARRKKEALEKAQKEKDKKKAKDNVSEAELNDLLNDKTKKGVQIKINFGYVVKYPGVKDVRKLGKDWRDGIKSIKFLTSDNFDMDSNYVQQRCMDLDKIKYQIPPKGRRVKDKSSLGRTTHKDIITSNKCKFNDKSQNFYIISDKDNDFSQYPDIYDHLHFHKHSYNKKHN